MSVFRTYLCALCGNAEELPERVVVNFSLGSICSVCFKLCVSEFQQRSLQKTIDERKKQDEAEQRTPTPSSEQSPVAIVTNTLLRSIAVNQVTETIVHEAGPVAYVLSKNKKTHEWDQTMKIESVSFGDIVCRLKQLARIETDVEEPIQGSIEIPAHVNHARYLFHLTFLTNEIHGHHIVIRF